MRRRSNSQATATSQATSPEKHLDSPSHHKGKRREVNNLDRAENDGGRHSKRNNRSSHQDLPQATLDKRHIDHGDKHIHSAKTFRRGRVIVFLKQLQVKRSTLMQQLQQPEFKSIEQVISGELKAVDEIIQQFTHLFELREAESGDDNPTHPRGDS